LPTRSNGSDAGSGMDRSGEVSISLQKPWRRSTR
jgi:hypothetical protein